MREKGFTLLELLITLAVATILVTMALPDLSAFVQKNRAAEAVNEMAFALNLARNSAITRARYVTVCKSADGSQCDHSRSWDEGWLVFENKDRDSPATVDPDETVLYVHGTATKGFRILANRNEFTFRPMGVHGTNGTLLFCTDDARYDRALVISTVGRIRLAEPDDPTVSLSCD